MDMSPKNLRAQFHAKAKERDAILAKSEPLRVKRDAMAAKHREAEQAANKEILDIEKGLFDLQNEIAALARALGGKTGEP